MASFCMLNIVSSVGLGRLREVHLCPDDGRLLRPPLDPANQCRKNQGESTRIDQRNGSDRSDRSDRSHGEAFPLILMAHQSCGPLCHTLAPHLSALWDALVVVLPLSQPRFHHVGFR